jgi:NADP-dependent 3-hydroxy acid dehydrogenase YdfG
MSGASLSGKTAFVTGAHRGIGRAIVEALTGESREVVMEKYVLTESLQYRLLEPQEDAG